MSDVADITKQVASGYALQLESHIAVVVKPRPRLVPQKLWLKLASVFIRLEHTSPGVKVVPKYKKYTTKK